MLTTKLLMMDYNFIEGESIINYFAPHHNASLVAHTVRTPSKHELHQPQSEVKLQEADHCQSESKNFFFFTSGIQLFLEEVDQNLLASSPLAF
jgi:hypothetical protein